jgi:hypothetical protein
VTPINRSQGLVLGFFAAALASLVVILLVDPAVYASTLRLPPRDATGAGLALAAGLALFLALVSFGVVRRWRWIFWLVLVAFLAGALRVPAAALQLSGRLASTGPAWYEALQGAIGAVQLAIGLLLLRGFRRAGPWGRF